MTELPPPGTSAEGQRLIYGILPAAGGMFCGSCAVAMVALLMWGNWTLQEQHSIVLIFGWALGGFIAATIAVIVGLLAGGPVGRVRMSAGREGASLEADSECVPGAAMILRLLNWQGVAGLMAGVGLLGLLIVQHVDALHWRGESARFEKLYGDEQLAFAKTTAAYREAADQARADDEANAQRVAAQQSTINRESSNDFEKRLADARAAADGLRHKLAAASAYPGGGGAAAVPRLSPAPGGSDQAAGPDELSDALTATEQAIQLDELIKWVRKQAVIDANGGSQRRPAPGSPEPGDGAAR